MEENNRKGPGVFYAVVGVATLVVAIIGATFAYFSAQATATGENITGKTNEQLASALSVTVNKLEWSDNGGAISNDLVPASFDDSTTAKDLTTKQVQGALNAKCVNAGYTGCHLYKIQANTTQTVANASILLDLSVEATVKDNWRYTVFTATGGKVGDETDPTLTVTGFPTVANGTAQGSLATPVSGLDIHNNASMTAGTADTAPSNTYYLLIYLANIDSAQNGVEGGTDETGTYTGTVTMNAAGGQVKASFTAAA